MLHCQRDVGLPSKFQQYLMLALQLLGDAQAARMAGDMPNNGPPSEMPTKHISSSNGQRCSAGHSALTPASCATEDAGGGLGQLVHQDESSPIKQLNSATAQPCRSTWASGEFAEVVRQCCEADGSVRIRKVCKGLGHAF